MDSFWETMTAFGGNLSSIGRVGDSLIGCGKPSDARAFAPPAEMTTPALNSCQLSSMSK
jgi:hypothetical protein